MVVQFVINVDDKHGCEDEVISVFELRNKMDSRWAHDYQNGKKVRVQYMLPIE